MSVHILRWSAGLPSNYSLPSNDGPGSQRTGGEVLSI